MKTLLLLLPLGLMLAGCGLVEPEPAPCPGTPRRCVQPSDGCDAPQAVPPTCNAMTATWSCPAGSRVYARAEDTPATCLPFHDPDGPISQLGGSLVRVPVDGGRCLWIAEEVLTTSGVSVRNVAFDQDFTKPFGSCPVAASFVGGAPVSAVTIRGSDDPTLLVQVDGGYRQGGQTHVLYRLFRADASAGYGVVELGTGLGTWDATRQEVVVPGPSPIWPTTVDLGDASRVVAGVPYVWGCHGPGHYLTDSCDVARLGDNGVAELYATSGTWVSVDDASDATTEFSSGPWISSVVPSPSGFMHVYAIGFGTTLESDDAPDVTGPWTNGPTLATCDLPATDSGAFCAGPIVHDEITDPTRPGELVVTYGVGSTSNDPATLASKRPQDYWSRLVWVP